jgi:quinol-cytochrome oxidoreductase complex cytochrome b subunit
VKEEEAQGYENMMRTSGVPFAHHMYREVTTVLFVITLQVALAMLLPFGLGEVATPDSTPKGVKPEWYFLPVYQLLKYFPKLVGILIINGALAVFVLLPFLDRNPERRPGKRKFMMAVAAVGLIVTLALGALGYVADRKIGPYEFDIKGIPHKVEEGAK